MARYIESEQTTLFLRGNLDQLLPGNSVARTLFYALEKLDFSPFDKLYRNDDKGRPAIHPKRLLAVWILALLRGVDSSSALAKLCRSDIEFRWCTQDIPVEKSTLCFFRKNCQEQLQRISLDILAALGKADLLPADKIGLDGTVLKAASSCRQCKTRKELQKKRQHLQNAINKKVQQIDTTNSPQDADLLEKHRQRVQQALDDMDAKGLDKDNDRLTTTEHDAKFMRLKDGGFAPAYNAQVVSDLQSGAIIHAEMTQQGNDAGQLEPQVRKASETLRQAAQRAPAGSIEEKPVDVVADAAYHDTRQLVNLMQEGMAPCVPADRGNNRSPSNVQEGFQAKNFTYDPQKDAMTCPAGQVLRRRKLNKNQTAVCYQAKQSACESCAFRSSCCPKTQGGRTVNRPLYERELATVAARVESEAGQRLAACRRTTVEGNMSRLKTLLRWRKCRCWGLAGAQAELLLRQISNNLMLLCGVWQPLTVKAT